MKISLLTLFVFLSFGAFAQITEEDRRQSLQDLRQELAEKDKARSERVRKYLENHPRLERVIQHNDVTEELYDISENGNPQYVITFNAGAAATTGANVLADKDLFGFALTGEGVKVGVWDGGLVLTSHDEFKDNSVIPSDGSNNFSDHATHVTGTIKAKGLDKDAKGMAPGVTMYTYDWTSDDAEMVTASRADQSSLLLSNHSYGTGSGWTNGSWRGDPEISDQEDWKFGFYDDQAANWDNIAFNAPYYLIMKSAGNDRGNSGSGPYPPDGPYDIISTYGNAKNILTVGAALKLKNYTKPADVNISSFSSFGPSDDGRIKPDIVGAGVGVYSTSSNGESSYNSKNGTSMSSPNVTGTLALLQELSKKLSDNFLRSAELKALVIHTAHEAGGFDGPDYIYGWGLMNGVGAAELLMSENGRNKIIENYTLNESETFTMDINPKEGDLVRVTIVWTDPAGSPVSPQLDPEDIMLVNDLDLRVIGSAETQMPYVLNPKNVTQAPSKGDNFRDNVEQVEFFAADSDGYQITVTHKNSLRFKTQNFSMVVSYESDEFNTYYRISNSLNWNDPEAWSLTTGGEPAGTVPGADDNVVFDVNTFKALSTLPENGNNQLVFSIEEDTEVGKFVAASESEVLIDLKGNTLTTNGGVALTAGNVIFTGGGQVVLKDTEKGVYGIVGSENSYSDTELVIDFENGSVATLSQDINYNKITVRNGRLEINGDAPVINELVVEENGELEVNATDLEITGSFTSSSSNMTFGGQEINFLSEEKTYLTLADGDYDVSLVVNTGTLVVSGNFGIDDLELKIRTNLELVSGSVLDLDGVLDIPQAADAIVSLTSDGTASITNGTNRLICLDFLNIDGVNAGGEATFNAGVNSTVANATGWQTIVCEEVIFADFSNREVCANSVQEFTDTSNGDIAGWKWYINDELVSESEVPSLGFGEEESYQVKLEVTGANQIVDTYITEISVRANTVNENAIISVNGELISREPSDSYQWYRDDNILLEGETNRSYQLTGDPGTYFVVTTDGSCFRKSPEFIFAITSTDDEILENNLNVYPNPASDQLTIDLESGFSGVVTISVVDLSGRNVFSASAEKKTFRLTEQVNTSNLSEGLYVVRISQGSKTAKTRLIAIEK